MRIYQATHEGKTYTIEQGEYGIHHGLLRALWCQDNNTRHRQLMCYTKSLKNAKATALVAYGIPFDAWKAVNVKVKRLNDHV